MENFTQNEKKVVKSNTHFEIYLEYVKLYGVLKLKWTVQRQYALQVAKIWQDMTRKLNNCGGPVRDVTHWKKVFTEWKSHTRRKLKLNKPLNDLEDQLVQLTGLTSKPERKNPSKLQKYIDTFLNKENKPPFPVDMTITPKIKQEIDICESGNETRCSENEGILSKNTLQGSNMLTTQITDRQEKHSFVIDAKRNRNTRNGTLHSEGHNRTSHIATQVDEELMEISPVSDRVSIGSGLQSLANALNRYCDIVEKRFT